MGVQIMSGLSRKETSLAKFYEKTVQEAATGRTGALL
jgi:hypothetical protein